MILDFVINNLMIIAVVAVSLVIFYVAFYLTVLSIKKMKVSSFAAYPFDLFIPNEKGWTAGYFLVIILLLGILIYFIARGNFYVVGPA